MKPSTLPQTNSTSKSKGKSIESTVTDLPSGQVLITIHRSDSRYSYQDILLRGPEEIQHLAFVLEGYIYNMMEGKSEPEPSQEKEEEPEGSTSSLDSPRHQDRL